MTDPTGGLLQCSGDVGVVPTFQCKSGCNDCCGLVPFSDAEKEAVQLIKPMEMWEPFKKGSWFAVAALASMRCPFLTKDGCGIYDQRPMVCRLFGAVDHPLMVCPHGCGPANKLTELQSRNLLAKLVTA